MRGGPPGPPLMLLALGRRPAARPACHRGRLTTHLVLIEHSVVLERRQRSERRRPRRLVAQLATREHAGAPEPGRVLPPPQGGGAERAGLSPPVSSLSEWLPRRHQGHLSAQTP